MELRVEDSGQALLTLDGYPLLQQITPMKYLMLHEVMELQKDLG
jgi:hypothetical protein